MQKNSPTRRHTWIRVNSRGESINHVCIFDEHQVQPTTSPLPACGHTHLLPSGLQKLTDVLQTTHSVILAAMRQSIHWVTPFTRATFKMITCRACKWRHPVEILKNYYMDLSSKYFEVRFEYERVMEARALTLLCSVGNAPMPTLVVYALTTP